MGRVKEPKHPLEKRDLLHAENPNVARLDGIVAQMIDDGRLGGTLEYLEITRNDELLGRLESEAIKEGSTFLVQQVARIRGTEVTADKWDRVIDNAKTKERWYDAVRALTAAGRAEEAEELRLAECPGFDPFKPLGK